MIGRSIETHSAHYTFKPGPQHGSNPAVGTEQRWGWSPCRLLATGLELHTVNGTHAETIESKPAAETEPIPLSSTERAQGGPTQRGD